MFDINISILRKSIFTIILFHEILLLRIVDLIRQEIDLYIRKVDFLLIIHLTKLRIDCFK